MRKSGITYLLAAAMLIGAASFSEEINVSADEIVVQTEDGDKADNNETGKDEANNNEADNDNVNQDKIIIDDKERPDESSDEGWITPFIPQGYEVPDYTYTKDYTDPDGIIVTDADNDENAEVSTITDAEDSAIIDEEDSATSKWISEYEYDIEGDYVILRSYFGTKTDVFVYKQAKIDGKTYKTLIQGQNSDNLFPTRSAWGMLNQDSKVEKIIFEDGVKFSSDCFGVFANCNSLQFMDLSGVDLSDVKDISWMFYGCSSMTSVGFGDFTASKVTDMSYMFSYCNNLGVLDLSKFNPKKLTNMERMFSDCENLHLLDISNLKTDYVTNAACMFSNCGRLDKLDLSKWDLSRLMDSGVTGSAGAMFNNCNNLQTLYSPKNLYVDIELPKRMYDPKGNAFNYVPEGVAHTKKLVTMFDGWTSDHDSWLYIKRSEPYLDFNPTLGKGWIEGKEGWYVAKEGRWNRSFTGIAKMDGSKKWGYANKGKLDTSFSGLAQATNGQWYYVNKGYMDKTFTGKLALATNGKWYYVSNGKPDLKFSGKIAYCTNGSWYYVTKGKIDRSFTGIAEDVEGNKYYVVKGRVKKEYTGTVSYKGKTYKVVKGVVK